MPEFSKKAMKEVDALFSRYPKKVHALGMLLHLAQRENGGYLPEGWDAYLAKLCETTVTHVRGVITFYNMYRTEPPGKYHVMVCTCVPCGLCGGDKVLEHIEHRLNVRPGQTTKDGMFSLEEVQCLAACDQAPLIQINEEVHHRVTFDQIDRIIDEARRKSA
jgi:NADH-quinone oxidoreductase E subunit